MRILIADDDPVMRSVLAGLLSDWAHEPVLVEDGLKAWEALQAPGAPQLAILDWLMPGLDGPDLCRRLRGSPPLKGLYVLLLTQRGRLEDIVAGLESGANDYVVKPFDPPELRARVAVGARVVGLQNELAARIQELEASRGQVRQLAAIVPICTYCKRIRDDQNFWEQVEDYVAEHTDTAFSHSICPECYAQLRTELGLE